jgi:RNA-directed DNA polymerase
MLDVLATAGREVCCVYPVRSVGSSAKAVAYRTKERSNQMARQKSDDRVVPQSRRKAESTRRHERREGGKAVTVNERTRQLELYFGTAEVLAGQTVKVDGVADTSRLGSATRAKPKPKYTKRKATSATMEEVTQRLEEAFQKVAANDGAPGPDRQSIEEVREHLDEVLPKLRTSLLNRTYNPGDIRRVWIPKAGGGQRGLGIPNVIDRVVQEAIRMVLEPLYEPKFHASSHGFRPDRSCQTAVAEARKYIDDGHEWIVDIDLKQFFDRVHQQRLMARLEERVADRRLLGTIHRLLKAKVVMPNGVKVSTDEGVPQGGPLSPLLSNIVLDELDRELEQRGHRFVRYADDCNIYVRSEQAGHRVMASIKRFIEKRLRLEVNAEKSTVARPEERHFVGFSLRREPLDGTVDVLLSKRSKDRIDSKIRELTPRDFGKSLKACIEQVNVYLLGWIGFFWVCTDRAKLMMHALDAHIRRRLRAIQLKHWKAKRTIARKLIQLGVNRKTAWRGVYKGRQSLWALSHCPAVDRGLRNAYFAERGLVSVEQRWRELAERAVAPEQMRLPWG